MEKHSATINLKSTSNPGNITGSTTENISTGTTAKITLPGIGAGTASITTMTNAIIAGELIILGPENITGTDTAIKSATTIMTPIIDVMLHAKMRFSK